MIQEQEIITRRAKVKSIAINSGVKQGTNSALISLLVKGICVPIYANVNNIPFAYLPTNDETLYVEYVEVDNKLIIKSYSRNNKVTYCSAI